ncbi:MAG: hypothetical protein ABFS10_12365 [Bacteroidota bacterium]
MKLKKDNLKLWSYMILVSMLSGSWVAGDMTRDAQEEPAIIKPTRTEVVEPIRNPTFSKSGACEQKKQGGNPRVVNGFMVFDGATDGNRQVDPQIAVGGGYVLHATNTGLIIYDKKGNLVDGVKQSCFNNGIDPKLFFDPHNRVFGFDLWNPWDKEKKKPVNISVSETSDPTGAWNTYPVPSPDEVDGGGIGYSRKWIGYSFPGGDERTFVIRTEEAMKGIPATVYYFPGSLGHPVNMQDAIDDLYFFSINEKEIIIHRVFEDAEGEPVARLVSRFEHNLASVDWPPKSPQKNSEQLTASGDRNPKVLVYQNNHIWFSQTINWNGRAAVQWNQVDPSGSVVQTGLLCSETTSYIQTTLAVNSRSDVLVGFQETGSDMFISPRMAFRLAEDPLGTLRQIVSLGEGKGATSGVSWGDYSGSTIDGDNLTDLWTIQSITSEEGRGHTVIARVPFQ